MNRYLNNIQSFLLANTVWIYLTLFLFFSHALHFSMVKETWGNYIYYFFAISKLYFPVLLYAFFRKQLSDKLPNWLNSLVWFYCFVLHLIVLHIVRYKYFDGLFPIHNSTHESEHVDPFTVSFSSTMSLATLATEIAILLSSSFREWFKSKKWSERLGLDQLIFLLVILLSVVLGLAANAEMMERGEGINLQNFIRTIPCWLYYSIQCFLALMGYYGFYYINKHYLIPKFLSTKGVVYYFFIMILTILIAYPILTQFIRLLPIVHEIPTAILSPFWKGIAVCCALANGLLIS